MKHLWKFVLPVLPIAVLVAMAPQGPEQDATAGTKEEISVQFRFAELQYVDRNGQGHAVPARNLLAVRLLEDGREGMRLEIVYENGDYSLIDAQAFHLLRQGRDVAEVRLVRTSRARVLFPRMP
jgi:hypothetical protein